MKWYIIIKCSAIRFLSFIGTFMKRDVDGFNRYVMIPATRGRQYFSSAQTRNINLYTGFKSQQTSHNNTSEEVCGVSVFRCAEWLKICKWNVIWVWLETWNMAKRVWWENKAQAQGCQIRGFPVELGYF